MGDAPTTLVSDGAPSSSEPRLLFVVGEGHFGSYPLPDGRALVLGRDEGCDVPLHHPKVSRRHVRVTGGPTVEVEDLGSTNGVRVGGRTVAAGEKASLAPGDSLEVGPFLVTVVERRGDSSLEQPVASIPIVDPTRAGLPDVAARVARSPVSVLIFGETGAGKEVLARTLHELSGRSGELVAVNCASLSETLLESELFGHERGAFTGAASAKRGLFEVAAGGTVLLDEIGELPAAIQAKLLRALESRTVYRLGGVKPVALDVRFLSATHRDLAAETAAGRFRTDLYFRVNGITMTIAPLRGRRDAIPGLAAGFLGAAAAAAGRPAPRIAPEAMAALVRHDWPGNVRELRTVMERALLMSTGDAIDPGHLLFSRIPAQPRASDDLRERLAAAAAAHAGNVSRVARALGTSRSQVLRLAARYGVDFEGFRRR